jgi:hypothetical protein
MRRNKLLFLTGVGFCGLCATVLFAQTLPSTVPLSHEGGIRFVDRSRSEVVERIFYLKGKEYRSRISWQEAESISRWEPSMPLPVSLEKAEEIALEELSKLVHDEIKWQFSEFSIGRFSRPTARGWNWYFALTMAPIMALGEVNADTFTVLINASGEPGRILGRATRIPPQLTTERPREQPEQQLPSNR